MKIIKQFIIFGLALSIFGLNFWSNFSVSADLDYQVQVFNFPGTTINIKNSEIDSYQTFDKPQALFANDSIQNTSGKIAEIIWNNRDRVRLGPDTEIIILDTNNPQIFLKRGQLWVNSLNKSIRIQTPVTETITTNAMSSINYDQGVLNIQTINHYSTINLINANKDIINYLILPSKNQVTIFEKNISERYQSLSAKKLRKELKQFPLNFKKFNQIEKKWLEENTYLDTLINIDTPLDINPNLIPGDFWYVMKTNLNDGQNFITIRKNKKLELWKNLALTKIAEIQITLDKDPNSNEIPVLLNEFQRWIKLIKENDINQYQKLVSKLYNRYAFISPNHKYYQLSEKLTQMQKPFVMNLKDWSINKSLQYINNLEDLVITKSSTIKQQVEIQKIQSLLNSLSNEKLNYSDLDRLRNTYYFLLISQITNLNKQLLTLNNFLEELHLEIANQNSLEIAEELRYEIIENRLILTDQIIEKTRNYNLAQEYIIANDLLKQVELIPNEVAFKDHLLEFSFLIKEKIINNINSKTTIKGESFLDFLNQQKKVAVLSAELKDENENNFSDQQTQIPTKQLKTIIDRFAIENIFLSVKNIALITGSNDKFVISNLLIDNQEISELRYSFRNDSIYELVLNSDQPINLPIKRSELVNFIKQKLDNLNNNKLINQLSAGPTYKDQPEDKITKLVKEIVQKEFSYIDTKIHPGNIKLLDPDGEKIEIKRAQIINTAIVFDCLYDRESDSCDELTLVLEKDHFIGKNIAKHQIQTLLKSKYSEVERLKQIKNDLIELFIEQNYKLNFDDIESTDPDIAEFNFKSIIYLPNKKSISGTFNRLSQKFIIAKINNTPHQNISINQLTEIIKIDEIKNLLELNHISTNDQTEIVPSISIDNRFLINNATFLDHQIRFTLNLENHLCSNILIGEDVDLNFPEILLEDFEITVEQGIKKILEEEKIKKEAEDKTASGSITENQDNVTENNQSNFSESLGGDLLDSIERLKREVENN